MNGIIFLLPGIGTGFLFSIIKFLLFFSLFFQNLPIVCWSPFQSQFHAHPRGGAPTFFSTFCHGQEVAQG